MLTLFVASLPARLWIAYGLILLMTMASFVWLTIAVRRHRRKTMKLAGYRR